MMFRSYRPEAIASVITALVLGVLLGCQGFSTSPPQPSGGAAAVAVNPGSISFGNQAVDTTTSQTVTIQNTGKANLVVQQVSVTGSATFQLSNWTGTATIPPAGQLALNINFTPVQSGTVSATLAIQTNASSNAADSISLTGSGEASSGGGPVTVSVSPVSASLGSDQTEQFTAALTGTTNTSVNWSVNDIVGGDTSVGTISSSGLYTAPACSSESSVTVTAASVNDSAATSSADVTLSQQSSSGKQYYVSTTGSDSNDGSACHPWATIGHAAAHIGPGATVNVGSGTYSGPISTSTSGTASSRIRYISMTQFGATIQCTSNCDMVWTQSGSYVSVMGFGITSTESATRIGIEWTGSHGLIQGNKVRDIQCSGCLGNGGAGINVDTGSAYTTADSNIVYNIDSGGKGKEDSLYVHGIYVHTHYNVISNNLVHNCAGWGVEQGHEVSNSTIVNNLVFECGGGVMIGTGGSSGTSNDNVINNNILVYNGPGYDGHGYGIDAIQNYGSNNSITDNLLYANKPGDTTSALDGYATIRGSITDVDPASGTIFVDWQSNGSGNYELKSGSPAIGAGTSASAPPFDIDGGKRPVAGTWDLGPYQYPSTAPPWPWD
jgi:hypothetical protein